MVIILKKFIYYIPYLIIAAISLGLFISADNANSQTVSKVTESPSMPVIILDAGHGGADGGAVAQDGTQEQYINLDITLKINSILKLCGYNTLLTRKDNNSIHDEDAKTIGEQKVSDIHNRLKIIESQKDCIFVSIHQNYYTESKYSGAQVFYSGNNNKSSELAQYIQAGIVTMLQPDNTRKIKQSGSSIYLLYYSTVPSVLVECGFLSNAGETKKLNDENYRSQMALAVFSGIVNYLINEESTE